MKSLFIVNLTLQSPPGVTLPYTISDLLLKHFLPTKSNPLVFKAALPKPESVPKIEWSKEHQWFRMILCEGKPEEVIPGRLLAANLMSDATSLIEGITYKVRFEISASEHKIAPTGTQTGKARAWRRAPKKHELQTDTFLFDLAYKSLQKDVAKLDASPEKIIEEIRRTRRPEMRRKIAAELKHAANQLLRLAGRIV